MVGVPAVLGATDPGSTRLVYAMVAGLVIIGLAFIGLGVWLIRQTRYDPPVLAPLERMGDRDWRKRDGVTQRRILDEVRPEGAEPLRSQPEPPALDAEFDSSEQPLSSMTDLGPGLAAPPPGSFPAPIAAPPVDGPIEESSLEADPVQDGLVVESQAVESGDVERPAVESGDVEGPAVESPAVEGSAVESAAVEGSPESADR
jgi:hypothetical protein